jgi:hypothetical protein
MTFLTPWLGAAVAAATIPLLILLYFLKLRRRDVEISTTLLWKQAIQDFQANAPFQRLRTNLLLLLQLLLLGLLAFAIAQPQLATQRQAISRLVIMIDRSASMNTRDETDGAGQTTTRLERAKQEALAAVYALDQGGVLSGAGAEVMLIAFDTGAQLVEQYTTDRARIRDAIMGIAASDAPTDFAAAAQVATPFAGPRVGRQSGSDSGETEVVPGDPVLLLTDGRVPKLDQLKLAPGSHLRTVLLGQDNTPNLAITSLRAERSVDRPDEVSAFVALQSTFGQPLNVDLEVAIDGTVLSARTVALPAGTDAEPATGGTVFKFRRETGGVLSVRALLSDALPSDNIARTMLPAARELSIALVSAGNWALSSAILAMNPGRFEQILPSDFDRVDLRSYDLIVMDGLPMARTSTPAELPPGRYLIFGGIPTIGGLAPAGEPASGGAGQFIDWHREHPALRHLALEPIVIAKSLPVEHDDRVTVLARGTNGPLILDVADQTRRALVVAMNPLESNWPLDVSFALFVAQASRWLGDSPTTGVVHTLRPGQTIVEIVPAGARNVRLVGPNESDGVRLQPGPDWRVSYGPLMRSGLYRLEWTGAAGPRDLVDGDRAFRLIPVNLFDAAESRVAVDRQIVLPDGQVAARSAVRSQESIRRLWPFLAGVGLLIVVLEWAIYHRRVHL